MKNTEKLNRKQSFGKLVKETSYENYAIKNLDNNINNTFIEKKTGNVQFKFAFIYNNIYYGVWYDNNFYKMYVSYDYLKDTPFIFSCTTEDHKENTIFIKSAKKYYWWKFFIENYQLGTLRFENQKIKSVCQELIKKIILS